MPAKERSVRRQPVARVSVRPVLSQISRVCLPARATVCELNEKFSASPSPPSTDTDDDGKGATVGWIFDFSFFRFFFVRLEGCRRRRRWVLSVLLVRSSAHGIRRLLRAEFFVIRDLCVVRGFQPYKGQTGWAALSGCGLLPVAGVLFWFFRGSTSVMGQNGPYSS